VSNVGIRSLIPVETNEDIREQAKAKAAVMKRINATQTPLPAARIADQPLVNFTPEFYKNPEPKLSKEEVELKKFRAKENPSIMQQAINYSPKKIPLKVQQKMKKILPINVDPDHPDGFTFVKDQDTYETYKDDPSRYTQELAYKYDGIPVKDTVKPYDALDKSSFPSNPIQQAALRSYGKAYDRLTPLQKTQIANAQKKKKQKENPKLFESIIDNLGKKK